MDALQPYKNNSKEMKIANNRVCTNKNENICVYIFIFVLAFIGRVPNDVHRQTLGCQSAVRKHVQDATGAGAHSSLQRGAFSLRP